MATNLEREHPLAKHLLQVNPGQFRMMEGGGSLFSLASLQHRIQGAHEPANATRGAIGFGPDGRLGRRVSMTIPGDNDLSLKG